MSYSYHRMWRISTWAIGLILLTVLFCSPCTAATGADLDVSILQYQPIPAEIGEYVTVWVKVENRGFSRAEDVSVRMVPEYPFTLDSPGNADKTTGVLSPGRAAVHEYRLFVDENARDGIESIEVWYQEGTEGVWYQKEFDIRVGSVTFDSRGSVQIMGSPVMEPEVFMPGDRGTIRFSLANTAISGSVVIGGEEFDTNARIQSASLESTDGITVMTGTYQSSGVIGPGESVNLTYNIRVSDDIEDGTYYLNLVVVGNSHALSNSWRIPVRIDSSSVRVIPSSPLVLENGAGELEFDVANIHPNRLSSVSVRLEAQGVEFSPSEYFIGSMDPDELFTIQFQATSSDNNSLSPRNLTIIADYRNGANQHSSQVGVRQLRNVSVEEDNRFGIALALLLLAAIAVGGYMLYKRRKEKQ
ncbi:MAG: COG1361 S-layer family protein [Methanolobus sp.]|uniref:COG1361 S-layer family protein n=1 Tax=Methanolobus sp. TaxID=1874737 RepID=UPI0027309690|nr:COG1361 S-layer family protein [Methanolobus sp.]MDP2216749.1 COG1361 S-layer family protein [Methanolobus sp.]